MKTNSVTRISDPTYNIALAPRALQKEKLKRINIGCGQTPTQGWLNYDNSLSVFLGRHPFLTSFLDRVGLIKPESKNFISVAQKGQILWADATKRIPLPDASVEVIYTSHMLEHFDRRGANVFLQEGYRVLALGGIIRVVVPDLHKLIGQYLLHGDADSFVEQTLLARKKPETLVDRIEYVLVGDRHHLWLYDGPSLCRVLVESGFRSPRILDPGTTTIARPGELNLYERASNSVYVEALK